MMAHCHRLLLLFKHREQGDNSLVSSPSLQQNTQKNNQKEQSEGRELKKPWVGKDVFLVHPQNSLNGLILNWCIGGC